MFGDRILMTDLLYRKNQQHNFKILPPASHTVVTNINFIVSKTHLTRKFVPCFMFCTVLLSAKILMANYSGFSQKLVRKSVIYSVRLTDCKLQCKHLHYERFLLNALFQPEYNSSSNKDESR